METSQSMLFIGSFFEFIKVNIHFVILIILIMLSGVFSASETALTAFKRIKLKQVEEENPHAAKLLKLWIKNPNEMLTTILLGNNIVNILGSSIAATIGLKIFKDNEGAALAWATLIMTILILIFGEITPKIIAKKYSENISKVIVRPIYYLNILFYPFILILIWISRIVSRFFGISISDENLLITENDIRDFVSVGEEEGVIEEEEREMIHSIFDFGDTTVKEIMVPRTSMFAIEANKTLGEIWDEIIETGFSRIPVFEDRIDNIVGVMYLKDLLNVVKYNKLADPVKNYIREAYFIPESKAIVELLREFREKKVHIAIILDEYGGTFGMLTIEDILEEIVGEINDEYDEEEEEMEQIDKTNYKVKARMDIEDLNKTLQIDLPVSEEYDTLGGYISYVLGRVPEEGDLIEICGVRIEVARLDKHRIEDVILKIQSEE